MSEYNSASFLNDIDKEELCSSAESTPSQVRRRMTDVKLTKEKYVDKAKSTISAGRNLILFLVNGFTFSFPNISKMLTFFMMQLFKGAI